MYIYYILCMCVYLCIQVVQIFECISILHNFLKNIFYKTYFEKRYIKIIVINHKQINFWIIIIILLMNTNDSQLRNILSLNIFFEPFIINL